MKKLCELYDRQCIQCGECEICDLDPKKKCNNCGKCINEAGDYRVLNIDEFLTKNGNKTKKS